MINYNPKSWISLVFNFHRSSHMRLLMPTLLVIGLLAGGMTYLFENHLDLKIPKDVSVHAFVGVVLGLVLVFRTNTSYDRWWEGRKLFGALTNHSRNMAIKLNAMLAVDDEVSRKFFAVTISNFYMALKEHLRHGVKVEELSLEEMPYKDEVKEVGHIPNHLAAQLQGRFNDLHQMNKISGDQFRILSREAEGMIDVLGGCERILKTPIPYAYSAYVKKVVFIYLLTLPLSLINIIHYWTIPVVMFSCYVLAGLELIGEEIEDPFGRDDNDLDTDGMALNVGNNVHELLKVEK